MNYIRGLTKKATVEEEGHPDFHKKYAVSTTVLGKGTYACVVLAQEKDSGESVAVKRITKEGLKHRDISKIHKEVNILKNLRHRNIVKVYDSYEDDDYFYMVMEYVSGGELFKQIVDDKRRFSETEARKMIRTLLMALKYCKDNGVVHRDLKPENILLTKEGEIKLVDFNLAKQVDKDAIGFNILETMCGTPNYVAPEIIDGTPYDYKCDIWSLGVISFLLLSNGFLPFFVNQKKEGNNAKDALLRKIKHGEWHFVPQTVWIDVSDKAKDFVSKMLVRDTDARYNYEQLLAHPWQKVVTSKLADRMQTITGLQPAQVMKMKKVATVKGVAAVLGEIMNETDEIGTSMNQVTEDAMPSGAEFFNSLGQV